MVLPVANIHDKYELIINEFFLTANSEIKYVKPLHTPYIIFNIEETYL